MKRVSIPPTKPVGAASAARLLGWVLTLVACSSTPEDTPGGCVPGASLSCACPDGTKALQVCLPDRRFEACRCGGDDVSMTDDTAVVPGTDVVTVPDPDVKIPSDLGFPTMDAGTPGTDAGEPGTDAGEPGTDAGEPGTDGGAPDGGPPADRGPAPMNDTVSAAQSIALSAPVVRLRGDLRRAGGESGCGTTDVYYRFTLSTPSVVAVSTFGSEIDTTVAFVGPDGVPLSGGCFDDGCTGLRQEVGAIALPAGEHRFAIGGWEEGSFQLEIRHVPIDGGDAQSFYLTNSETIVGGTNQGANAHTPGCVTPSGPESHWFFTTCPDSPPLSFSASTCEGTNFDTVLEYRTASSPGSLCNDDACGTASRITGELAPGYDLHVFTVDSYSEGGDYQLRFQFGQSSPDAGTPPPDAGTPGTDAGTPPRDAGSVVMDASFCPGGSTPCGARCSDLRTSQNDCGACGNACATGQTCTNGVCTTPTLNCDPGTADCDRQATNGCEVDTRSDTANCGACGRACGAAANAVVRCVAGTCVSACDPGFEDCDGNSANGCEIDTRASGLHCGACNRACPAGSVCNLGTCQTVCGTGLTACGATCANLQTSTANCGACGRPCAAGLSCVAGQCTLQCATSRGNCDGVTTNGCETDLTTNANHCGACGNRCPGAPNATPRCAAGRCGFTCATGRQDCDNNPVSGCETDVLTNNLNCGACRNACRTDTACAGGVCRPANDAFARAATIAVPGSVSSVTLTDATLDGSSNCTSLVTRNVWYRFSINDAGAFAAIATNSDVRVNIVSSSGSRIQCGELVVCGARAAYRYLSPGTYYLEVADNSTSPRSGITIQTQFIPTSIATYFDQTPLGRSGSVSGLLTDYPGRHNVYSCGGSNISGGTNGNDRAHWMFACGSVTFSLCPSNGGSWTRGTGTFANDPVLAAYGYTSFDTGTSRPSALACADNGCPGTGGDTMPLGPTLNTRALGLVAVIVDKRQLTTAMPYSLGFNGGN